MKQNNGAEIIVEQLIHEKVPYLFGLCGHGIVGFMDAAMDREDRIGTVSVHNEQIAGFAADAYYRVTRQPCATFTSCGPGSINIQMAVANAFFDSSAMFVVTGNVPTQQFNRGPFQELGQFYQADFITAMRPYVKRSYQAVRAEMLPHMVRQAYATMMQGKVGPVHLDVPFNVFMETTDEALQVGDAWSSSCVQASTVDDEVALRVLDMLDKALAEVDNLRSELGAVQNRFQSTIANLANTVNNLSAARSRIEDADYAVEVSNMTRAQILQQAGTSVLAQANQVPQTVLSLLR